MFYKIYLQWIYWTLLFIARCSTIFAQWSPRDGNPRITQTSTCFFDKKCLHSLHEHTSLHFTAVKADTFTGYLHLYWQNQPACTLAVHQFSMRPSLPQTMSPDAPIAVITAPRSARRAHTIRGSLWILRHIKHEMGRSPRVKQIWESCTQTPKDSLLTLPCFLIKSVYLHTICKILNFGIPAENYTAQKPLPVSQSQLVKKIQPACTLLAQSLPSKRPLRGQSLRKRSNGTKVGEINRTHTYTEWITSI
jgi:hypothetical protein